MQSKIRQEASKIRQEELQQEIPGIKNPPRRNIARNTNGIKKLQRRITARNTNGVKNPLRRITATNTRRQESAEKNNSKNYQVSRIRQEEIQQELPGIKNPLRRPKRRNQASIIR